MRLFKPLQINWIIVTALLLVPTLYLNWTINLELTEHSLSKIASQLSDNLDGLIEDLFQEVYTLPIYGEAPPPCDVLYPMIERITYNNPIMAGLILKTNKEYCATLPEDSFPTFSVNKARTLIGPKPLSIFDQPVYLVQQQMGHFRLGIVLLSSVLQTKLQVPLEAASYIALSDATHTLLRLEHTPEDNQWILSHVFTGSDQPILTAKGNLQSLDKFHIVVTANEDTLYNQVWISGLISSLMVIMLSYLVYSFVKYQLQERYSLRGALKLALKHQRFFPVYQLLYDTKDKRYSGVEMLMRWQELEGQIIMPDLFAEEAEKTGMILQISMQLIETAFKEFQNILTDRPYFHLGFNLCAQHFSDLSFFEEFERLRATYHIDKTQLLLEITERELIDANNSQVISKMQALREEGYSLAVDDYGTGHASISYLRHFPFNYLKIDKIFVQAIGSKAVTESLNDTIIQMSHDLHLTIIAEGVETKAQADYLTERGVRLLQGYYFAKPLSLQHLIPLLGEPHVTS